jgi:hypothetical protein
MKNKTTKASVALFAESIPHELVAERAYSIWAASGRPSGRDHENWVEAQQQMLASRASEESTNLESRLSRGDDPFNTDIDRALDAMSPTSGQRSATSL